MTIAVAALWPWGHLASLSASLSQVAQARLPQAAILIADSRWTIRKGSNESYIDVGTKLFRIARDAGAVYAGHVESGEECLNRLARRFGKGMVKKRAPQMAGELFAAVHARHETNSPLRIFVGACDPRGLAEVWYFGNESAFKPVRLTGVNVIAYPGTECAFRAGLEEVVKENISNPNGIPLKPDRGALWLVIATSFYVLDPGIDKRVGGPIQCAVVDQGGFRLIDISSSAEPSNPNAWRQLSPRQGELKTLRPRMRRENSASSEASLALYQVTE